MVLEKYARKRIGEEFFSVQALRVFLLRSAGSDCDFMINETTTAKNHQKRFAQRNSPDLFCSQQWTEQDTWKLNRTMKQSAECMARTRKGKLNSRSHSNFANAICFSEFWGFAFARAGFCLAAPGFDRPGLRKCILRRTFVEFADRSRKSMKYDPISVSNNQQFCHFQKPVFAAQAKEFRNSLFAK